MIGPLEAGILGRGDLFKNMPTIFIYIMGEKNTDPRIPISLNLLALDDALAVLLHKLFH